MAALYLALDRATAISDFHQCMTIPGTVVAHQLVSAEIADLTNSFGGPANAAVARAIAEDGLTVWNIKGRQSQGWQIAEHLTAEGAHGALVPSVQNPGGANLVLLHWSRDGSVGTRIAPIDPDGDLDIAS